METLWWSKNRLLRRRHKGIDVGEIQRELKFFLAGSAPVNLRINRRYDAATIEAVKEYQKFMGLKPDGMMGPITKSVLNEGYYKFIIKKPKVVLQNLNLCWAASVQSILPHWRGRKKLKIKDLKDKYKAYLNSFFTITNHGMDQLINDINANYISVINKKYFYIEDIIKLIHRTKAPLLLLTIEEGFNIGHVSVIYGFGVKGGAPYFLVMNPLSGYDELDFSILKAINKQITFAHI